MLIGYVTDIPINNILIRGAMLKAFINTDMLVPFFLKFKLCKYLMDTVFVLKQFIRSIDIYLIKTIFLFKIIILEIKMLVE